MRSVSRVLLLLVSLFLAAFTAAGQTPADTTKAARADTVKHQSGERLFRGLFKYSQRKGLLPRALRHVLKTRSTVEELDNVSLVDNSFGQHDYKIVREIEIRNFEPFGYSVGDTLITPDSWLEKAGNAVHFKTHRGRIRKALLFRQYNSLEPEALAESERLLRQTPYILDARLLALPAEDDDSVDVLVLTKDIWSLSGSGSFSPGDNRGGVGIRDVNFLGFGHTLRAHYDFGLDLPQTKAYEANYLIPNFSQSYVNAEAHYRNRYPSNNFGLSITRDFYTFTTKHAGGIYIDWFDEKVKLVTDGPDYAVSYTLQDGWVARSFRLRSNDLWEENRTRFIVGGRIRKTTYKSRPVAEQQNFANSKLYLLSAGLSHRAYFRDKYLFGFGRTEDVPTGHVLMLTGGYDNGEFERRAYSGLRASGARYSRALGYLYGGAEFGSFWDGKRWEQGVVILESQYFSKLLELGHWKLRQYGQGRLSYGINRRPGESLNIANENGIRGFRFDTPIGTKRFVLNFETNLFTPFSLLGFRMAFVAFADFSWIAPKEEKLFSSKTYQGYGLGLRFRNEYLIFSTIQLVMAYYPHVPPNQDATRLLNSSSTFYDFRDFNFSQPLTAPF